MRRLRTISLVFILAIALCSIFVHPFGKVKAAAARKPLMQGVQIETPVLATLKRSCRNCHSEETVWPWYSYIAPVSWLIEKDVQDGRDHFNMSRWDEYTLEDQSRILAEISAMVRRHEMPLSRYTLLHPDAKLTDQDIESIDRWGHAERKNVKANSQRQLPGISGKSNPKDADED